MQQASERADACSTALLISHPVATVACTEQLARIECGVLMWCQAHTVPHKLPHETKALQLV